MLRVLALWLVAVACVVPTVSHSASEADIPYPVSIQGPAPRTPPEQAAQKVLERLGRYPLSGVGGGEKSQRETPLIPQILSADLVDGEQVGSVIPTSGALFPGKRIWVVQARGVFVKFSPGVDRTMFESGYYLIDDETGEIVGRGAPAPRATPR